MPSGSRFADIGTDHALLPAMLAASLASCVASDSRAGPLAAARRTLERRRVDGRVELRQGDGLSVLRPGEVDVVCVAGLGAGSTVRILRDGRDVLEDVERLILQPTGLSGRLRRWLRDEGWELVGEELSAAGAYLYEILIAERGADTDARRPYRDLPLRDELALLAGPHLLRERSPLLLGRWRAELAAVERALAGAAMACVPAQIGRLRARRLRASEIVAALAGHPPSSQPNHRGTRGPATDPVRNRSNSSRSSSIV